MSENDWIDELDKPVEATGPLSWRTWHGSFESECPPSLMDKLIHVRLRDGSQQPPDYGRTWAWYVSGKSSGDIMTYAVDASEWTDWEGDHKCPVEDKAQVEFLMRDGDVYEREAGGLRWNHTGFTDDIMKYRVIEPDELELSS